MQNRKIGSSGEFWQLWSPSHALAWNPLLITAKGRSTRALVLEIALFRLVSFIDRGCPLVLRCIVLSIEADGFMPKYPLSRYTVSPLCKRSIWLSYSRGSGRIQPSYQLMVFIHENVEFSLPMSPPFSFSSWLPRLLAYRKRNALDQQ